MSCRLHRWLVLIALIVSIGGHWAILQTVAWVGMTVDFSKNLPVTAALEKTFSGKSPCQLCHLVARGKSAEQQQDLKKQDLKTDWCLPAPAALFCHDSRPVSFWPVPVLPELLFFSPPSQPPRVA